MGGILAVLFGLIVAMIYFIPAIVAYRRDIDHKDALTIVNILFGWSGVMWLICLLWAILADSGLRRYY